MNESDLKNSLKSMNLTKNSKMEKFDKGFSFMFKFIFGFIVLAFLVVIVFWSSIAYVVVSKGPETVQRIERVTDAYADKLEQETKNQKKPE